VISFYLSLLDTAEEKDFFEQMYLEHRNLMYAVAKQVLHDNHMAEDAVHSAFLRIIQHVDKLSEMDFQKIKGFLIIIAKNTAIDMYHKQKRKKIIFLEDTERVIFDGALMEDAILERMEVNALVKGLQELSEMYRDILILRYLHNLSYPDISQLINISEENARKRLERAKEKLLMAAKEEGYYNV